MAEATAGTGTLSPKDLARLIGVSESSVKRWVDGGLIDVTRTVGGHRRITVPEALRFIRANDLRMMQPELLGLPDINWLPDALRDGPLDHALYDLLTAGEASAVRGLLIERWTAGDSLAALFDEAVAPALNRIGEIWQHGPEGIYVEHVATNICIDAVTHLQALLPVPGDDAPVAIGGAAPGDPYFIPSLMTAAVLSESGIRAINLGADTPPDALDAAVAHHKPRLVWVAVASEYEPESLRALADDLVLRMTARGIDVIAGG
ncbi:MAG: B12-binding domain-containing protein, partial [Bacteroidota bacterium]